MVDMQGVAAAGLARPWRKATARCCACIALYSRKYRGLPGSWRASKTTLLTLESYMACKRCQSEVYRMPRKWWERLIGVRRAAVCGACGHRAWSFTRAAAPPSPTRQAEQRAHRMG
jgi:hypothetical protein